MREWFREGCNEKLMGREYYCLHSVNDLLLLRGVFNGYYCYITCALVNSCIYISVRLRSAIR